MRGFIVKNIVVRFKLFVIKTSVKASVRCLEITLPIRKKHKIKQQEIIN